MRTSSKFCASDSKPKDERHSRPPNRSSAADSLASSHPTVSTLRARKIVRDRDYEWSWRILWALIAFFVLWLHYL